VRGPVPVPGSFYVPGQLFYGGAFNDVILVIAVSRDRRRMTVLWSQNIPEPLALRKVAVSVIDALFIEAYGNGHPFRRIDP
jgi:hypothetical protein